MPQIYTQKVIRYVGANGLKQVVLFCNISKDTKYIWFRGDPTDLQYFHRNFVNYKSSTGHIIVCIGFAKNGYILWKRVIFSVKCCSALELASQEN